MACGHMLLEKKMSVWFNGKFVFNSLHKSWFSFSFFYTLGMKLVLFLKVLIFAWKELFRHYLPKFTSEYYISPKSHLPTLLNFRSSSYFSQSILKRNSAFFPFRLGKSSSIVIFMLKSQYLLKKIRL